jgi:hypothetical protein
VAVPQGGINWSTWSLSDFLDAAARMTPQELASTIRDMREATGLSFAVLPVINRTGPVGPAAQPTSVVQIVGIDSAGGMHNVAVSPAGEAFTLPAATAYASVESHGTGTPVAPVVIPAPAANRRIVIASALWTVAPGATAFNPGTATLTVISGGVFAALAAACPANDSRAFKLDGPLPATFGSAVTITPIGAVASTAWSVVVSYFVTG